MPFFELSEFQTTSVQTRLTCQFCSLAKKCKNPRIKPNGKGDLDIMFISDLPHAMGRSITNKFKKFDVKVNDIKETSVLQCDTM